MQKKLEKIKYFLANESFRNWIKKPDAALNIFWENWFEQFPEEKEEALTARNVIEQFGYLNRYDLDQKEVEIILWNIRENQEKDEERKYSGIEIPFKRWWWAAAGVLVISGFFYANQHYSRVADPEWKEVVTGNGERKMITLPDESKVILNANSRLRFPEVFEQDIRKTILSGEGFFEVTKNPEKPFVVTTDKFQTNVLGTRFNVRAYSHENQQSVALVSGKVRVKINHTSLDLHPDEIGIMNVAKGSIEQKDFEPKEITGWKDGILLFRKAGFDVVFNKLEEMYGVRIKVQNHTELKGHYSGEFEHATLTEVLNGIAYTSDFKFRIDKNQVIISN